MQLLNGEIIGLINVINDISEKDMPVELAFKFFGNLKNLTACYEAYAKTLQKIIDKGGVESPDDPKISEEVGKLLNLKSEVEINKFERAELVDGGMKLTLSQLAALSPIIEE